ncbi:hypothetical protein ACSTS3_19585 [Aquimarina muelleri]|uniref:hypothetical protein n=1 Tax=Aquimarina muelleri TaxID=279356 RepID=UPI003F686C9D
MKTYVITLSKAFLKGHINEGKPTNFKQKFLNGEKRHTIRTNYDYWSNIVDEVNDGNACLSVREWSELPYRSKQIEIGKLFKLGKQKIHQDECGVFDVDGKYIDENDELLAKNDGLEILDFYSWFNKPPMTGIIIHFTDLRYNNYEV